MLAVGAGVALAGAFIAWGWGTSEPSAAVRAEEAGTLWAVSVSATTAFTWGWTRWRRQGTEQTPTAEQVTAASDYLALAAATYWGGQARRQGITLAAPVVVRWHAGPTDLAPPVVDLRPADPAASVVRTPASEPASGRLWPRARLARWAGPHQASSPVLQPLGQWSQPLSHGIVTAWYEDLYVHLQAGEVLVVLGQPGAGKSGALLLLLLQALAQRDKLPPVERAGVRVPVWVTCGEWDPGAETLPDHVAATLARTYPALTQPGYGGPRGPAAQLQHGRVAVFLDGLDEMPPELQPLALQAIRTQASHIPVIVTSRTAEFRIAMSQGGQQPAGIIELLPVTLDAATSFLQSGRQPECRRAAWQPVIDHVRAEPDGPLAQVLATPLGLCLARDTYVNTDPATLIPVKGHTARTVLASLIGAYLDHSYAAPGHQRRRDEAVRWLSWIAHHLGTGRDLHWWDPTGWVPGWHVRILRGLTGGLAGGLVAGLGTSLTAGLVSGAAYGIGVGLTVGAVGALGNGTEQRSGQVVAWGPTCRRLRDKLLVAFVGPLVGALAVGLAFGFCYDLESALIDGPVFGVLVSLVAGLAASLGVEQGGRPRQISVRRLAGRQWQGVLLSGLAVGLIGLMAGLLFWRATGLADRPAFRAENVLTVGIAGLVLGLILGLTRAWASPLTNAAVNTPVLSYRIHRSTSATAGIVVGLVFGMAAGIVFGYEYGPASGCVEGTTLGLSIGLAAALTIGAAARMRFTELALLFKHGRTVRFIPLLEDALGRQLLRQAGVVYQFRHAELQDYFAARYGEFWSEEDPRSMALP